MTGRRDVALVATRAGSLKVANDVAEGRFGQRGDVALLDSTPDWRSSGRIGDAGDGSAPGLFEFGVDLVHAAASTGSTAYVDLWRVLVGSWIDQIPADYDPSHVTARRLLHWIDAWQRFEALPEIGPLPVVFQDQVAGSVAEQFAHVRSGLTDDPRHRAVELSALLIVGLALPGLDPDQSLVRSARDELYRTLCLDILPDGVHRARSLPIHAEALRSFIALLLNARRFGLDLPPDVPGRVERAAEFLAAALRPDGAMPRYLDARALLEDAAEVFVRDDLRYVATAGREGRLPETTTARFPEGGYVVHRSGWGDGADDFDAVNHLIFDCGLPAEEVPGPVSPLHIEVFGGGSPLVTGHAAQIDPGSHEDDGPWSNTVTVDRRHPSSVVPPVDPGPLDVRWLPVRDAELTTRCAAELVRSDHDVIHRREVRMIAGSWWLVIDGLFAREPHQYDLRFHLDAEALSDIRMEGPGVVRTPNLALLACRPASLSLERGWVTTTDGEGIPTPIVSFSAEEADCFFLTAVIPLAADEPTPEVLSANDDVVEMVRGTRVDRVRWRDAFSWGRR